MQFLRSVMTAALVAGGVMLCADLPAQGLSTRVEGSRPGQTFVEGQPAAPAARASAQASGPQRAAPDVVRSANSASETPVILEFSDLQCPDSARYNVGLKNTIIQRYVASGRAGYQWHDFPLPVHDKAIEAASAARCAGAGTDQVRHQIMAHQGNMSPSAYAQYAAAAGVNQGEFSTCLRSGNSRQAVMADRALGESYGVRGTPTLVLGMRDGAGKIRPVKLVKAYDPPQQVLAQIDTFLAQHGAGAKH